MNETGLATDNDAGWYQPALARVHDDRFTQFARAAAQAVLQVLPPPDESGPIVDLGCGSGATAAALTAAGYSVIGVDASAEMLRIARVAAPTADFVHSSIYDFEVPPCQAVLAVGEIINYATAGRSDERLDALLRRISQALPPRGVFMFDCAHPGRVGATPREFVLDTDEWTLWTRAAEDPELLTLTRRIVTFERQGHGYSRHNETHVLQLIEPAELQARLAAAGLRGTQLPAYAELGLPVGWSVWSAVPAPS